MRDKTHLDQIERWARHVKEDPNWKKQLKPFVDSQIIIARRTHKEILELPNGADKLKRIRNLK